MGKLCLQAGPALKIHVTFAMNWLSQMWEEEWQHRHPIKSPNSALLTSHSSHSRFLKYLQFHIIFTTHNGTGTILVTAAVRKNLLQPGEVMPTYLCCLQM